MNNPEQPTYIRQRYLSAFIDNLPDKGVSRTNLQKLIFLSGRYTGESYYDFIPYKFGPYSFQMDRDIDVMCRDGFLKRTGGRIRVNKSICFDLKRTAFTERGDDLIRRVYREYPYYAVNSTILQRLFDPSEASDILRRGEISRDFSRDILFTIGYEGRTLEAFINTLIENGVKLLCDVRRNPVSRKFGFSGGTLRNALNNTGIKYAGIPELGIESEKRASLNAPSDYTGLFADYRASMTERAGSLARIRSLFVRNHRIALMCYEKDPAMCHRNIIREKLEELYGMESVNL